jgi:hypothetical protein
MLAAPNSLQILVLSYNDFLGKPQGQKHVNIVTSRVTQRIVKIGAIPAIIPDHKIDTICTIGIECQQLASFVGESASFRLPPR